MQNTDNITNIINFKFKENMWCDKELEDKMKLRYYKEVVNPNLEDQNYLLVLKSANNKINIAKIGTKYTKWVEDEKHFLLDCPAYTHIRSQFKNICHVIDLPNLLSHQNYGDLGTLLSMIF